MRQRNGQTDKRLKHHLVLVTGKAGKSAFKHTLTRREKDGERERGRERERERGRGREGGGKKK